MPAIQCTDASGQVRTFNWTYIPDQTEPQHSFRVETIPPLASGDVFELTFTDLDPVTVRQTWIGVSHPMADQSYRAKGIPDAMLPVIKQQLARDVQSSPAQAVGTGIYRTVEVEKMWQRLVAKNLAVYDQNLGVYRVV